MGTGAVPEDGQPLRPMRRVQWIWRSVLTLDHDGHEYAVDANFFDVAEQIHLYVDGERFASQPSPARFEVPGGVIDASIAAYGWKEGVLHTADGTRPMTPAPGTVEHARRRFAQRYPVASALVSTLSWLVLALGLTMTVFGVIERTGGSVLVHLSGPAQSVLAVAAVCAGLERAVSLRNHWLLDE